MNADLPGDPPDDRPGAVPEPLPGDLLGDIAASEPGLDVLLSLLAAEPTPDELAGQNAALAMFRSSRPPAAALPGPPAPEPSAPGFRAPAPHASRPHAAGRASRPRQPSPRQVTRHPSGWHARPARRLAAAVTLAAAAGLAIAAYTEALPTPLQHAAYGVLGFAGIPDAPRPAPATVGSSPAGPGRAHGGSHAPGGARASAPASPRPGASASASGPVPGAGPVALSVTAASGRIAAGGNETFTGRLTDHGRAVAGVRLSLQERAAGQPGWRPVGSATTDADGRAVVTVKDLTTNAGFRLAGPGRELSRPVLVMVVPPVSVRVTSGPAGLADILTASSPLASPGNAVVLQVWTGTRWQSVQARNLNPARQAAFLVRVAAQSREYRVLLLPTVAHGLSVSPTATIPAR